MRADVVIVGSGPAGVHAAAAVLEAGRSVAMIDGGLTAPAVMERAPAENFEEVRRTRLDQHLWFLGEDYSGIPLEGPRGGVLISGNRSYVARDADRFLPIRAPGLQLIQSLAAGGLGAVWGAECHYFDAAELASMGLPDLGSHYDTVTVRIGVSGPPDRAGILPPLPPDHHARRLLDRYAVRREAFERLGARVVQPHTAVLTEDRGARRACARTDMEYYADPGRSVWRPQYLLEELRAKPGFSYLGGRVVERVEECGAGVRVEAVPMEGGARETVEGARLVMAAGAIGTARILARSFGLVGTRLPFLTKPHLFVACLHPATLGEAGPRERVAFCQLMVLGRDACAQLYPYRSFQLFRLLGSVPLPVPQALGLLALWTPSLVIADLRFATRLSPDRSLRLEADGVHVEAGAGPKAAPAQMRRALRALGLMPLKTVRLPEGSASHYAGTVPAGADPREFPLGVDAAGRLHRAPRIYVADASVFRALPAPPPTMTIMANADRVGREAVASL
jgi:choline dehydrogenase-like flavoprotein